MDPRVRRGAFVAAAAVSAMIAAVACSQIAGLRDIELEEAKDASAFDAYVPPRDAGADVVTQDANDGGLDECATPAPIGPYTYLPANPPIAASNACTKDEIAAIANACFLNADGSLPSTCTASSVMVSGSPLTTACKACAFSVDTDPKWGPIVASTLDAGSAFQGGVGINVPGCIDIVTGVAGVGDAYNDYNVCLNSLCDTFSAACSAEPAAQATADSDECDNITLSDGGTCSTHNNISSTQDAVIFDSDGNLKASIAAGCFGDTGSNNPTAFDANVSIITTFCGAM